MREIKERPPPRRFAKLFVMEPVSLINERFDMFAEPETPISLLNEPPEKARPELRLVVGGKR